MATPRCSKPIKIRSVLGSIGESHPIPRSFRGAVRNKRRNQPVVKGKNVIGRVGKTFRKK